MRFHIVGTQEVLISHSGLALTGVLLQGTRIKRRSDRMKLGGGKPEISHGDNVLSMIGLLCMGKSDFEAINAFEAESDEFFRLALGLGRVPSEPTLRQRLDALGARNSSRNDATAVHVLWIRLATPSGEPRRPMGRHCCWRNWRSIPSGPASSPRR